MVTTYVTMGGLKEVFRKILQEGIEEENIRLELRKLKRKVEKRETFMSEEGFETIEALMDEGEDTEIIIDTDEA